MLQKRLLSTQRFTTVADVAYVNIMSSCTKRNVHVKGKKIVAVAEDGDGNGDIEEHR